MAPGGMAVRLRQLRMDGFGGDPVPQKLLAHAIGVSTPLVSSWEHGKAVPPDSRLEDLARFFASQRSAANGRARLLPEADLTDEERDRYLALLAELRNLRPGGAAGGAPEELITRSPWEGMWHFPDHSPVTLVCARLPEDLRASEIYTSPESPDYVELYSYSDLDALMELYGHVYAANPGVTVNRRLADSLTQEDVTNHLVLLGGVDWNPMTRRVMRALDLPVAQDRREGVLGDDPDVGSFRAPGEGGRPQVFRSQLEGDPPHQRLVEDVAQFCRGPNPFNRKRTVTICNGNYGRGTYAAVRTLTDPRFRDRNRAYIEARYSADDTYSILARASIVAGEVITPDWTRDGTVLHEWSKST
ncbi:helix-turn-helix transcriptional regulator [Actinoplanes sp. NPDC049548]|uniref:helix-turn-helix domain-containing protein n=1 Tax=Actinoplanes sp. NPDC049548 TaxID=3155152 RepID=UPI00341F2EA9